MPNHCTNRLTLEGSPDDLRLLLEFVRGVNAHGHDAEFTFHKIIPMPECLRETVAGSDATLGLEALGHHKHDKFGFGRSVLEYQWVSDAGITTREELFAYLERERPEALEEGRKCLKAFEETGFYDWYDWSLYNWGTKWDAYDVSIRQLDEDGDFVSITFDTAWSPPMPVFEKLSELFPNVRMMAEYVDEGCGFWGVVWYLAGEEVSFKDSVPEDRDRLVRELQGEMADGED